MPDFDWIIERNQRKVLFTPGPPPLLRENFREFDSAFGRGDGQYDKVENKVLDHLRKITGSGEVVRLQGSSTLAIEIMATNFLTGSVVVVDTGFYSERLYAICQNLRKPGGPVRTVTKVHWSEIDRFDGSADWLFAAPVETSKALRIAISDLKKMAERLNAKLMLDATGSIGLEEDHELADAMAFSSCKGLFGFTGAGFIAYEKGPTNAVNSFYMDIEAHRAKKITGPYHQILSLAGTLDNHEELKLAVQINKERCLRDFSDYLILPPSNQPQLCTALDREITTRDARVILYQPRESSGGSILCHLGEAHLGAHAHGDILSLIEVSER